MPARTGPQIMKDLTTTNKWLKEFVKDGVGTLPGIEKQIKDQAPIGTYKNSFSQLDKEMDTLAKDIKETDSFLKDIEKTLKLPDNVLYALFKDQKEVQEAWKLYKENDPLLTKAEGIQKAAIKRQKELEVEVTGLEKQVAEELKTVKAMDASEVAAKKSREDLSTDMIKLPGMEDQMYKNFKLFKSGELPKGPALIATSLKVYKTEVTEMGKAITTANSVSDSLEGFLKDLKDPYDLNASKATKDGKKAFDDLEAALKKAKPFHQDCLKWISEMDKKLKEIS